MEGATLGPYRILNELGSGGMGRVYRAVVLEPADGLEVGRTVAIKVIHPHLVATPQFVERFRREAKVGQIVEHENVVRTLAWGVTDVEGQTLHFLVMEYVEGQTLRDLMKEVGSAPEELCRHIAREVTKGLSALHAVGAVHRDMKPENVLITRDHVVKVMDLGVALLNDEVLQLSQTGGFVGSLHYAAPECFRGEGARFDARADLHALGLVLYELAGGANPNLADGVAAVLQRILEEEPRRLGEINPQLSPFFEEVVHCLLAKKPDERFATADELRAAMEEGEEGAWWHARSLALQAMTRRPIRRIRIPRETGVYGREDELATLTRLYEAAKAGDGQVVVVEGEAGIGKSRLVDELVGRLQRDGEDLDFLFGGYPPYGAAMASGAFCTAYRAQLGEEGAGPWLPQHPALVAAFDALLTGDIPPPDQAPLTQDALHTCFVHTTRNLAAERTTVVLIDDLHHAPEDGVALFHALALAVPDHRILLMATARPGVGQARLLQLDRLGVVRLELDRLGPRDLVALLRESLRSEHLAEEIAGKVAVKSDGNPFFVFEILRGLREGQFLTQSDDGSWMSPHVLGEIQIPASVLDLVTARVADLDASDRDLLDLAACCGYEFDPLLIAEAVGLPRIPLLKQLGRIERRHRLVRASGPHYVFDHHQVQEALYAAISEPLRCEYHAVIAAALETHTRAADADPETLDGSLCTDLCEQFLKGARGARALPYLAAAQEHLERGYVNAQAVELAERALAVPDLLTGARRVEALLRLCGALERLGRRERQEEAAEEALRLADASSDDELRGRAADALGMVRLRTFRLDEAAEPLDLSFALAEARGDRAAEARSVGQLGALAYFQGRHEDAQAHHERARALSRDLGDREGEATALGNLGVLLYERGRLDEARALFQRQLALSAELGDPDGEATAETSLGAIRYLQGELPEAWGHYERALTLSRQIGDRESEAIGIGNLANVLRTQGRLVQARDHYLKAKALAEEVGNPQLAVGVLSNLGPVWTALGDRERADETLRRALDLSRELGIRHTEGHVLESLGVLAHEDGDAVLAERYLVESLALRREIEHPFGVVDSLIEIADVRRQSGDAVGAQAALEEATALAREQGRGGKVAVALAMAACLPGGDVAAAETAVAMCDAPHHAQSARWLLWTATGDTAHLAEAKRLLGEAVDRVPKEHRASMGAATRASRAIEAAWQAQEG